VKPAASEMSFGRDKVSCMSHEIGGGSVRRPSLEIADGFVFRRQTLNRRLGRAARLEAEFVATEVNWRLSAESRYIACCRGGWTYLG
jgi:hypothetical protein